MAGKCLRGFQLPSFRYLIYKPSCHTQQARVGQTQVGRHVSVGAKRRTVTADTNAGKSRPNFKHITDSYLYFPRLAATNACMLLMGVVLLPLPLLLQMCENLIIIFQTKTHTMPKLLFETNAKK